MNFVVKVVLLFDFLVKQILPELGKDKHATNEKARRLLGWSPRSREDAVEATGRSLVERGLLKHAARAA